MQSSGTAHKADALLGQAIAMLRAAGADEAWQDADGKTCTEFEHGKMTEYMVNSSACAPRYATTSGSRPVPGSQIMSDGGNNGHRQTACLQNPHLHQG